MLRCDSKNNYRNCQNQFWTQYPVKKKTFFKSITKLSCSLLRFVPFWTEVNIREQIWFLYSVYVSQYYTVSCISFHPSCIDEKYANRRSASIKRQFCLFIFGALFTYCLSEEYISIRNDLSFRIDDDLVWPQYKTSLSRSPYSWLLLFVIFMTVRRRFEIQSHLHLS